ncbi:MAG: GXWXG domain-containing protein [Dietzia sp.]
MSAAAAAPGTGGSGAAAELDRIRALESVPSDRVVALWDSLAPARVEDIAGCRWRGTGLDTGHPMYGTLGTMRWWGKDFTHARKVDPILVTDDAGGIVADTTATGGGGASLWEVTFRGRPTASMVYDRLPVIDHFAVVDTGPDGRPATLLAVMNGRGTLHEGEHFWFVLERDG